MPCYSFRVTALWTRDIYRRSEKIGRTLGQVARLAYKKEHLMTGKSTVMLLSAIVSLSGSLPAMAEELRPPLPTPARPEASDSAMSEPFSDSRSTTAPAGPTASDAALRESLPDSTTTREPAPPSASKPGRRQRPTIFANLAGTAIEIPAAMCRQSARELDAGVKDLTNDSSNPMLRVPAAVISLPFCLFAGCVEGALYAVRYRQNDNAPPNIAK